MIRKHYFSLGCAFIFSVSASAQKGTSSVALGTPPPEHKVSVYGFARNEVFYNSKGNLDLRGVTNLYPLDHSAENNYDPNSNAKDDNTLPQLGLTAMITRFGFKFGGLKALGAKVSGAVEADFFGITTTGKTVGTETLLRLRLAYAKLEWEHRNGATSTLLGGQYWAPLFLPQNFPATVNFSSGLPVSPFAPVPQFRYTYRSKKGLGLTGIVYGHDMTGFSVSGAFPAGTGIDAAKFAILPAFAVQAHFDNKKWFALASVEGIPLSPDKRDGVNGTTFIPINFMVSAKYTHPWFTAKIYGSYGDLYTSYVGIGGFVGYKDSATSKNKYEAARQFLAWADIALTKHKNIQPAIFIGYQKNLGFSRSIDVLHNAARTGRTNPVDFYGRAFSGKRTFDYFFKIAPRIDTYWGRLKISLEYELSMMKFINPDYAATATEFRMQAAKDAHAFTSINHRLQLNFVYYF